MPDRTIITAPAGAGKTRFVIDAILQEQSINGWSTVWVLLPTELQISAFRDRLLNRYQEQGLEVVFGVRYFQFYKLYTHLLDQLRVPYRMMDRSSVFRVLRKIIDSLAEQGQLPYFMPIVDKPGLIDVLTELIFELKQAHVTPERLADYASQSGRPKDQDISRIYMAYQDFLRQNDLVDREGAGWLALATLESETIQLDHATMVVVDGFTQFSPLQTALLNKLSEFIPKALLTLTLDDERATTLHHTFAHTLDRLQDAASESKWKQQPLSFDNTGQCYELRYLEKHFMSASAQPIPANNALHRIEAPDQETEAQMVLKRVKQQLLDDVRPDDIILLARNMETYGGLLQANAARYGIPLMLRRGPSLSQNPAITAILDLIRLHDRRVENFRRQAVLSLLRNPYFQTPFSTDEIDILERLSLRYQIVEGRSKWFDAIEHALVEQEQSVDSGLEAYGDDEDEPLDVPTLNEQLYGTVENFFARITPPSSAKPVNYILWIEELIGQDPHFVETNQTNSDHDVLLNELNDESLRFYEQLRRGGNVDDITAQQVVTRDLHAMRAFRQCLQEMAAAYDLVDRTAVGNLVLNWSQFLADLEQTLKYHQAGISGPIYRSGHVLATTVFDGRGLPHDHVYILGLSEGEFPAPRKQDPLYSDLERRRLNEYAIAVSLPDYEEDDASIFYTCAAMAQKTLTLSRSTIDGKANVWPSSVLWQATIALLENPSLQRIAAGAAPDLWQAADMHETTTGLAYSLANHASGNDSNDDLEKIAAWLEEQPVHGEIWNNIRLNRHIEALRRETFDKYSGVLENADLLSIVSNQLGVERVWSASQLNDYGYCPFRFYAKRLLRLEEFVEPEEGLDALQFGSLQHEILEYTYRRFRTDELAIIPKNLAQALDILHAHATQVFADAPIRHQFRASGVWLKEKEEILTRLEVFLTHDFGGYPESPFSSNKLNKIVEITDEHERFVFDVEKPFGLSNEPPASIPGHTGELLARGLIDRIDRVGDNLFIIDYKSGTNLPNLREIERARNFQMMLYLLAAKQMITREAPHLTVRAGLFWSIRRPEKHVIISADEPALDEAQMVLHDYIEAARNGDFRVQPKTLEDGKCSRYCEYHHLCRMVRSDLYKRGN